MKQFLFFFFGAVQFAQAQNYFQQQVDYKIEAVLNDKNHSLSAFQTIEYTNNSNQSLSEIWFHIWPNAYKNQQTALSKQILENGNEAMYFSSPLQRGYIDSLDFRVDEQPVVWQYDTQHIDICKLTLNTPLKSGEKITITTPFYVKIPVSSFSRLGHYKQSYQLTQWYPKPAVFDQQGWHAMPYLDQGEFFSEFGSFDVRITLPENYVVGATGDLQTPSEQQWLDQKSIEGKAFVDSLQSKSVLSDSIVPSSTRTKTIRYTQENVHDFAWFADKRWHVLKSEVELPSSKEKVALYAMFLNHEAHLWKNSMEYMHDAIYYYSKWNGDYPYKQMTAVDAPISAGGGMEYPNITVIGASRNAQVLETVIMHEIGHQWFYGVLGSNERDYPWMDEGINSFNELRYMQTKYPNLTLLGDNPKKMAKKFDLDRPYQHQYYLSYLLGARLGTDQGLSTKSKDYTYMNYGTNVYMKSAVLFNYLFHYLGQKTFDQCMQQYFKDFKFKHPYPKDVQAVFEQVSGKDLSWFFKAILPTDQKIDYKVCSIKKAKHDSNSYHLKIKNKQETHVPFLLGTLKGDSIVSSTWHFPTEKTSDICIKDQADQFVINPFLNMPELYTHNNRIHTKGLFKKIEPLQIKSPFTIERGDRTQVFYTPLTGYNTYDNYLWGLGVYNSFLPAQKFNYQFFPMYSFQTKRVLGYAHMGYKIVPKKGPFRLLKAGVGLNRFTRDEITYNNEDYSAPYLRINPYIDITLRKKYARSKTSQYINLSNPRIREESLVAYFENLFDSSPSRYENATHNYNLWRLTYELINTDNIHPFQAHTRVEYKPTSDFDADFIKAQASFKISEQYNKKGSTFSARVFLGGFITNNTNNGRYNFRMDGNNQRGLDYAYDQVFLARSENAGLWSQHFYQGQGNFKVATPLGQSNEFLSALNLTADAPFSKLIGAYADFGYNANQDFLFNSGVYLGKPSVFCVYLPVASSQNIQNVPSYSASKYYEKIRFVLNFNLFNIFKQSDKLLSGL